MDQRGVSSPRTDSRPHERVRIQFAASNRPAISDPMMHIVESGGISGGIWMLHNYWKIACEPPHECL